MLIASIEYNIKMQGQYIRYVAPMHSPKKEVHFSTFYTCSVSILRVSFVRYPGPSTENPVSIGPQLLLYTST